MFSRDFLKDAAERVIVSFAGALLAAWGAEGLDVLHANWVGDLSLALGAALVSLLKCLLAIKVGSRGTASLTDATVPTSELAAQAAAYGRHAAGLQEGPP